MDKKKKGVAYVVPQSHWDREWRYPLWKNRFFLVKLLDELLETLENDPDYKCFVMDGQVVPITDYLEIRPENEERIKKQVQAGRLKIGPWYTLPDLYPLDGECLVRNLLKGIGVSAKFGGHFNVGYHTFGWGQTAQFPQIYKEFGIDFLIPAKRVSRQRAPDCEFLWEAPDGTQLLATRLGDYTRANFFVFVSMPVRWDVDYAYGEYPYDWEKGGKVIHNASPEKCHEDFFKIEDNPGYYKKHIKSGWQAAWDAMKETTVSECRLILGGCDFTDHQPDLPQMLKDANEVFDDIEFVQASIDEYALRIKELVDYDKLHVVKGELRDGPPSGCSANALATRMYIKIMNKQAQNLIMHRTEPIASILAMMGVPYETRFMQTAWNFFLKSHPHDSINGVTQDVTADDTVNRLQQALQIGHVVHEKSVIDLVRRIDLSHYDKKDVLLMVLNPSPRPLRDVVQVAVDLPQEQEIWSFILIDAEGTEYPVQIISRNTRTSPVHDTSARPWPHYTDRHMVWIDPGTIPAGGYKIFKVKPVETFRRKYEWWSAVPKSIGDDISVEPNVLENKFLKVTVAGNGTLSLLDKSTQREYIDLHYFEDGGDVGDYWLHTKPYTDQVHSSLAGKARIWREHTGPLAATVVVEVIMTLPAYGYRPDNGVIGDSRRDDETKELIITSRLTLKKGGRKLDIKTTITNTIEDHRLRVLFPTGIEATHSDAAGHFTVDKRPIEPAREPDGSFYPGMLTLPMQQFVDVSDGKTGFAILNNSLTEYEVLQDYRHTVAITLFRSVRNLIATEMYSGGKFPMQKGGQCLRTMEFEYSLYPHEGDWASAGLYPEAEKINVPPTSYITSAHDDGLLPDCHSLFSIEPENLILSAFKRAEDRESYILRIYNPTEEVINGEITLNVPFKKAFLTNLDEERQEELTVENESIVRVVVNKGKISTLEFQG